MGLQVEYTPTFKRTFKMIFDCGLVRYSNKTLNSLSKRIVQCKTDLSLQPYIGAPEPLLYGETLQYRYIVIKPYFKLIYTVYDDVVYFSAVWDTRQSPETLVRNMEEG